MRYENLSKEDAFDLNKTLVKCVPYFMNIINRPIENVVHSQYSKEKINLYFEIPYDRIPVMLTTTQDSWERAVCLFRLGKGY